MVVALKHAPLSRPLLDFCPRGNQCDVLISAAEICYMQVQAVRQELYELQLMDFLLRAISLEADLHLTTAVSLSSNIPSADSPAPQRTGQSATSCARPAAVDASVSTPAPASYSAPQKASFRKSSSRLRLPSLPPDSSRSPKISARYSGAGSSLVSTRAAEPDTDRQRLPLGFVSQGDLEEDMQQLLEMGSQVAIFTAAYASQ